MKIAYIGSDPFMRSYLQQYEWEPTSFPFFTSYKELKDYDVVLFLGGHDVTPSFYDSVKHHTTMNDYRRDLYEYDVFKYCLENNIPMVGICRGAQFLNVMNGGKLIQDLDNHTTYHMITTTDYGEILVSSSHHQMMMPTSLAKIIGETKISTFKLFMNEDEKEIDLNDTMQDIEILYYKDTKCLCHQPHPEYMNIDSEYSQYFKRHVEQLVENKL